MMKNAALSFHNQPSDESWFFKDRSAVSTEIGYCGIFRLTGLLDSYHRESLFEKQSGSVRAKKSKIQSIEAHRIPLRRVRCSTLLRALPV